MFDLLVYIYLIYYLEITVTNKADGLVLLTLPVIDKKDKVTIIWSGISIIFDHLILIWYKYLVEIMI